MTKLCGTSGLRTRETGGHEFHSGFVSTLTQHSRRDNDNADNVSNGQPEEFTNSGTNSNYSNTDHHSTNTLQVHYMKMVSLFKEILLMVLVCIIYTAFTHDFNPPKIGRPPEAFPFFSGRSKVLDLYKGEISMAINEASESDVVFIMVYAPWDAESQEVRDEFERAADVLRGVVKFTAVNCWQPNGECQYKSNKVFSWPVFLAYTAQGKMVQYNGPKNALHIVKFLTNVLKPYHRLRSVNEVHNLLIEHDVVILASIDCKADSKEFAVIYNVALKLLEKDPLRETAIAIVSKENASIAPQFALYLWNETLIYPSNMDYKSTEIITWISNRIHQLTLRLTLSGTKSQQFASYLQGPSLILFTPLNPLADAMDYYISLKMIAMDYYNCNKDLQMTLKKRFVNEMRLKLKKSKELLENQCKNIPLTTQETEETQDPKSFKTVTFTPIFLANASSCPIGPNMDKCPIMGDHQKILNPCCSEYHIKDDSWLMKKTCQTIKTTNNDKIIAEYKTSMNFDTNDKYSSENLKKLQEIFKCRIATLNEKFSMVYSEQDADFHSVQGLSCHNVNRTLSLIAMDSLQFHHFAETFDLDVLGASNKTALLLIDPQDESHYVFRDGYLTDFKIQEFIANYTFGNLSRAFTSSSKRFDRTHLYNYDNYDKYEDHQENSEHFVEELTSENFIDTILEERKMVVVLYHSKQCSFCSGFSHVFLETSRLLSNLTGGHGEYIKFARIDADMNTLPWEYTMETLPTIILFPSKRKSESRAFPTHLPLTIENLLGFLLVHSDASMKLRLMWTLCLQANHPDEFTDCVKSMRIENMVLIEETLKEWRLADLRRKPLILHKLQKLKIIHTKLAAKFGNHNTRNGLSNELDRLQRFETQTVAKKNDDDNNKNANLVVQEMMGNQISQWKDDL